MTESSIPNPSTPAAAAAAGQPPAMHPDTRTGAEWFWWITFLSLLYTLTMPHYGGGSFGLGITMLAHIEFADQQPIAYFIDAIALGFFYFMGYYGGQGKAWAFYLGLSVYMLDALICVWLQDWWAVGFHAVGTYIIVVGMMSLRNAATSIEPMTSSSPAAAGPTVSPAARSGAKWFLWICCLSIFLVPFDSQHISFVLGLGITQWSDMILPGSHSNAALFNIAVYGFFCIMFYFAHFGRLWAFILGLVAYLLDALICAWVQDWWSVAFHAVVACFILRGALALKQAPRAAA